MATDPTVPDGTVHTGANLDTEADAEITPTAVAEYLASGPGRATIRQFIDEGLTQPIGREVAADEAADEAYADGASREEARAIHQARIARSDDADAAPVDPGPCARCEQPYAAHTPRGVICPDSSDETYVVPATIEVVTDSDEAVERLAALIKTRPGFRPHDYGIAARCGIEAIHDLDEAAAVGLRADPDRPLQQHLAGLQPRALLGVLDRAAFVTAFADARPETVLRDRDGDRWTLEDDGYWSCLSADRPFDDVAELARIYGPMTVIALPVSQIPFPLSDPWAGHPLWAHYGGPNAPRCQVCHRPYSQQEAAAGMTTCEHCPPPPAGTVADPEGEAGQ